MNEHDKKLEKAKDAFYAWEEKNEMVYLSDDDRVLWCLGFIEGMNLVEGKAETFITNVNTVKTSGKKDIEQLAIDSGVLYVDNESTYFTNNNAIESLEKFAKAYVENAKDTVKAENAVNTPKKILGHKELNKEFLDFLNVYYGTNFTLDDIWAVESLDDSEFAYGKKWANKIELALIFFKQGYYINKKWS